MPQIYKQLRDFPKHKKNPFIEEGVSEMMTMIKKKNRMVQQKGRQADETRLIINQSTGEVEGHAQFVNYMKVDEDKFAKVYRSQIKALYDLNTPAIRIFAYIVDHLPQNSDTIIINYKECMEFTGYSSMASINKGISKLIDAGILARTEYSYMFFINIRILFNGNRISLIEEYFKDPKKEEKVKQEQEEEVRRINEGRKFIVNLMNQVSRAQELMSKEELTEDEKEELSHAKAIFKSFQKEYGNIVDQINQVTGESKQLDFDIRKFLNV